MWALNTIGPAHRRYKLDTHVRISEIAAGFEKGAWKLLGFAHAYYYI